MWPQAQGSQGRFGWEDGKPALIGVGQLWVRRGSGRSQSLGAMTWVWTWPEVTAGPRAFGWVAWGFTAGSFKQAEGRGL